MTYTADDFKKASFAEAPGKKFAARVDSTAAALQWRANDGDWYSDGDLVKHGWVPVQESRPLTLDDLSDEELAAMTRRAHAEAQLWCASKDLSPALINTLLAAALTPPQPRPEGAAELGDLLRQADLDGVRDQAGIESVADYLASNGVRVTKREP